MTKQRAQLQKGFTLVELLLYLSLTAIILTASSVFIQFVLEARIKNQVIREVDSNGQLAMEYIARTIANAETIEISSRSAAMAVMTAVGLEATTVTPAAQFDSTESITLTNFPPTVSPVTFSLSEGVLQVQEGDDKPVALTNNKVSVGKLNFQNLSIRGTPGIIKISFVVSYVNQTGRSEYSFSRSFTTSAALR